MAHLSIRLLGPFQVSLGGEPVSGFSSDKVRALLAYLVLSPDRPHRREMLAGLLWPEFPERSARTNLRNALANLRNVLAEHASSGDGAASPPFLHVTRQAIQFNVESDYWLDADAFEGLVATVPPDSEGLEQAASLVRGLFLEGFSLADAAPFEEWLLLRREHFCRQVVGVLHRLAAIYEGYGAYEQALAHAWRRVELEPWQEDGQRHLMRLLALSDQRSEALAQYEKLCRSLQEELCAEPAQETNKLYEQIRRGEIPVSTVAPVLDWDPGPPPGLPGFLEQETEAVEPPVFVTRERELARLNAYLDETLVGHGQAVFVTGGPGRGKTALLAEFGRRAMESNPDLLVVSGNCNAYSGVGDPYLPFRYVMAMLTGDVEAGWNAGTISQDHARRLWKMSPIVLEILASRGPQLVGTLLPAGELLSRARMTALGRPDWLERLEELAERQEAEPSSLEKSHFFEQYANVLCDLAARRPLLIALDDLQWADAASSSLLFYLGQRLAHEGGRILIAGAYRPEEVVLDRPATAKGQGYFAGSGQSERHLLQGVLGEFRRRFGDTAVDLGRVEEAEGRRFVTTFLDTQPNRLGGGFRAALFRQTGGHPLFTIELLRAMQERGDLVRDEQGRWMAGPVLDWQALPVRVEAVVAERMGRLPDSARKTLQIASVEGETFTAEVVARVLGINERQVLRGLDRLDREHRLVGAREIQHINGQRLSVYRFRHILFQKYLYNSLSEGERAYQHEDVGAALEALYGEKTSEIAVRLALHFQKACVAEKAIEYLSRAGDRARGLYAHDEAIDCYQRSLALLRECREHEQAARTLMKLGLTHHSAFDFRKARQAYEEGFALWQQAGQGQQVSPLAPVPASHTLRVDWTDPKTLDPTRAWDLYSACVIDQLFSGLVEYSPGMGVTPDVAQYWEVLEGGRKYVFHLRGDVRWIDGTPVTAGDFAYAWRRVLDPAADSASASLLYDVKGARAFHQAEKPEQVELGIWAPDNVTLVVELERPTGYFPYLLAHHVSFPIPQHIVEAEGEAWAAAGTLITNGPFQLQSWQPGQALILERNSEYHGGLTGNVRCVELSLLAECAAQWQRYESDEVDIFDLGSLPPLERDWVRQEYAGEYVTGPSLGTMYVGFDVSRPPFDDLLVRRALILATDREYLAGVVMQGYNFPATGGLIPPGMPGHSAEIGLPYDPDQARDALAQAGYPGGRGLSPVDLLTFRSLKPHAEGLVSAWQKNLNVEIACQAVDYGEFVERMNRAPPRMFLSGWTADYPDPDNFLRVSPVQRYTQWQNRLYAELVETARQAGAQEERLGLYKRADQILIQEAVVMPLVYMRRHLLVKPWIKKLPMSPIKHWFWKDAVIEAHEPACT